MMRRLLAAVFLKGLWKFKPIHVVVFWLFLAYQGWMGSPYFMYYVVGAPEPGTAPRYVGIIRMEGRLERTRDGWIPPRYVIETSQGDVQFHCYYRPEPFKCTNDEVFRILGKQEVEIGYDPYWGVDYFRYPPSYAHLDRNWAKGPVDLGRRLFLKSHRMPAIVFCAALFIYLCGAAFSFRRRGISPT